MTLKSSIFSKFIATTRKIITILKINLGACYCCSLSLFHIGNNLSQKVTSTVLYFDAALLLLLAAAHAFRN
jgi:hypothetical protein